MEAKELRIGSYYSYDNSTIKLDGSTLASYLQNDTDFNLEPIPLTEEWFLKFGFEERIENDGNLPCFKKYKYTIAKWFRNSWQFWIDTVYVYNSPQYVHQLQNLYFALTDEELTYD